MCSHAQNPDATTACIQLWHSPSLQANGAPAKSLRQSHYSPPCMVSLLQAKGQAQGTAHAQFQSVDCRHQHRLSMPVIPCPDSAKAVAECFCFHETLKKHSVVMQRPATDLFLAHRGLKCTVRQMEPPRYIFAVLPSSSGILISGAVAG